MAEGMVATGTATPVRKADALPPVEPRFPPPATVWSVSRSASDVGRCTVLATAYTITALGGLSLDAVNGIATAVWPPSGIAVAALLLHGYRLWPGIACGALISNLITGVPAWAAVAISIGSTAEALLAAYLLRQSAFRTSLDRLRDVGSLVAWAALLSTLVSASVGVFSAWLSGRTPSADFTVAWATWWMGDAVGVLVVAPVLLTWRARPSLREYAAWYVELGVLLGLQVFVSAVVLAPLHGPVLWSFFPFVIWAALRCGQRGATAAVLVASGVSLWIAVTQSGSFGGGGLRHGLTVLQLFMGALSFTGIALAAGDSERRQAERAAREAEAAVRDSRDTLERRVEERTAQLQRLNEALHRLSSRLLTVQDEERRRIGRELHDSAAQTLACIAMNLSMLQRAAERLPAAEQRALTESGDLVQQCVREIRTLSYVLHPPLLDDVGLVPALRWYADGFANRSGIAVEVNAPEAIGRLAPEVETALFRVVQESLVNVYRHRGSDTDTVRIQLARLADAVTLSIEDHGPPRLAEVDWEAGVGIMSMRERMRALGGEFEISASHTGTVVRTRVPLTRPSGMPAGSGQGAVLG